MTTQTGSGSSGSNSSNSTPTPPILNVQPGTSGSFDAWVTNAFSISGIFSFVNDQTAVVNQKLQALQERASEISIADMFEIQMKMNRLSQFSEMATSLVSAIGSAITSIAHNIKS